MRTDEELMKVHYDLELTKRKIAVFEMHLMTPQQYHDQNPHQLMYYRFMMNAQNQHNPFANTRQLGAYQP